MFAVVSALLADAFFIRPSNPVRIGGFTTDLIPIAPSMNPLLNTFEMIDDQMAAALRQKTDVQRLRSVDAFWNSARAVLKAAIRTEHPDWSPERVQIEIARRISNGALDIVDS